MAHANYGIVDVEVGKETYTLTPSLRAMNRLNDEWDGGLRGALNKAEAFDPRDLAKIIAIGADLEEPDLDAIAEAIFDHGALKVGPSAVAFVLSLLNPRGSKTETVKDEEPGEKKPRRTS